jgi:hypothetical protein
MSTYRECILAEFNAGHDAYEYTRIAHLWRTCDDPVVSKEHCERQAQVCELIASAFRRGDEFRASNTPCMDCHIVVKNGKPHLCRIPTNYGVVQVERTIS